MTFVKKIIEGIKYYGVIVIKKNKIINKSVILKATSWILDQKKQHCTIQVDQNNWISTPGFRPPAHNLPGNNMTN